MLKRTIVGLVLLGVVLLALYLSTFHQIFFDLFVFAFSVIGMVEIWQATRKAGYNTPLTALIVAAVATYPLSFFFDIRGVLLAIALAFAVGFVQFIFEPKIKFVDFTATIFVIVYPFLFFGLVYALNNHFGLMPFLIAIFAAVGTDIMAYFVGSACKKWGIKLFPKISPKKTLQGFIGGIFGGALGALFAYYFFEKLGFPANITYRFTDNFTMPILVVILIGFITAPFAELGDLAASRVKRELGIKDYGKLLGSHGGVMDRLDSILFSVFVMTVFMYFIIKPV